MCSIAMRSTAEEWYALTAMSGSLTFDIDKKKHKQGEFETPPHPTGKRSG